MKQDTTSSKENERISDPDKFTLNDLHLASVYWPLLMQVAKENQHRHPHDFLLIQYAELVSSAKRQHPDDLVVENAINTSIGRKLDPINWFCRYQDLPNLTCLAVNANGEPGYGYMRNNDWESEKAEVASFDWSSCSLEFEASMKHRAAFRIAKVGKQRREMNEQEARDLLWAWWNPRRETYPHITHDQREAMVKLIRKWVPVEEAVAAVLGIE